MNARDRQLGEVMERIAYHVEDDPVLRALAAESKVFEHFKRHIQTFRETIAREAELALNVEKFRLRVRALIDQLVTELECIHAASQLAATRLGVPSFTPPSKNLHLAIFVAHASAIATMAERNLDDLVEAGMHPRKVEDVRRTISELVRAHTDWAMADNQRHSLPAGTAQLVRESRTRIRQLYYELLPAMTSESREAWRVVAQLGRTHRPAIKAPSTVRRLTAGTMSESAADPAPGTALATSGQAKRSLGRLAHRVVLRIAGIGDVDDGNEAHSDDVAVGDIGRLPPARN